MDILINYIFLVVYNYFAKCITFEYAINCLNVLYVKPTNKIFTQHILATCGQRDKEYIDEYAQELEVLVTEHSFKAVNDAQNWDECIRDRFITSLCSNSI